MTSDIAAQCADTANRLSRRVRDRGITVAVAESLTSGAMASSLGATVGSSEWFRGGVVAYSSGVKYDVLRVDRGPVVTRSAAETMAREVAALCGADLGIATTGVGGPAHDEDLPPGTVFVASAYRGHVFSEQRHFPGSAEQVLASTINSALMLAIRSLEPRDEEPRTRSQLP